MAATNAIIKKEFRSYFSSPVAYIVLGVFSALMGVIFVVFVSYYSSASARNQFSGANTINIDHYISQFFANVSFVMCFLSPMFTIKLFAEEKRQNTFELLLTAPISSAGLVMGKFFSALTLVSVLVAVTLVYMGFLVAWGNPDLATIATTYLGLFLLMSLFIAGGSLISALTNSQVIAFVLSYFALLVMFLMQAFGQATELNILGIDVGSVLTFLSPIDHQRSFTKGVIQLTDVFYFLSGTALFLFFTHRVVEGNRWR